MGLPFSPSWIVVALGLLAPACGGEGPYRMPAEVAPGEQPRSVAGVVAPPESERVGVEWQPWSRATFSKARADGKRVLLYGSAAWCHWCHVMDATTYRDPEVVALIANQFVPVRVDVDARPDIEERYREWGWPALVLLSPEGDELGKFRGYLSAEELTRILKGGGAGAGLEGDSFEEVEPGAFSAPVVALPWVAQRALRDMHRYYDSQRGGWGTRQKAPLGENAQVELLRGARGDRDALQRGKFSLQQQAALIDPVWGGIYQHSSDETWQSPHYEKRAVAQAVNLEAYAFAYRVASEPNFLKHAQAIASYVQRFLTSSEGTFFTSQDADLGTHDTEQQSMLGRDYYELSEKRRLAVGVPWVDRQVYAQENGLMLGALVRLQEAEGGSSDALARAERAAQRLLSTHLRRGAVVREPESPGRVHHLVDAAALGWGLCRVAEGTGKQRYREAALAIARTMDDTLLDTATGAYFAHTRDPDAWGVFAQRQRPLRYNVVAARFLSCLHRVTKTDRYRAEAQRTLAAVATPAALDQQGRLLGGFLLALDEAGIRLPGGGGEPSRRAPGAPGLP